MMSSFIIVVGVSNLFTVSCRTFFWCSLSTTFSQVASGQPSFTMIALFLVSMSIGYRDFALDIFPRDEIQQNSAVINEPELSFFSMVQHQPSKFRKNSRNWKPNDFQARSVKAKVANSAMLG